jgi:zinc/manganese transport system substrate-binding protein
MDSFPHLRLPIRARVAVAAVVTAIGVIAGPVPAAVPAFASSTPTRVVAVGAENEYADVISQVGGAYVSVSAIMSNPNTDPHEFEASASVAEIVSKAQLIVQNGVGYDTFMNKMEAASPRRGRQVIVAQQLTGVPNDAFNPHLWYNPRTMPAVANAVATAMSTLEPAHKAYFEANATRFIRSLQPWLSAIADLKQHYGGTPVAVTEPVADYMLQAAGADIMTPQSLQAAIMNGTDPSPQDITTEDNLLAHHKVKVFLYNQQVTDSLTAGFLDEAQKAGVPVAGVYETMPVPGYHYQSWMLAETGAYLLALTKGQSTVRL